MPTEHTHEDSLRVHDVAVYQWLGGLLVDYGDGDGLFASPKNGVPILRVFAAPDNAMAAVADRLVTEGWSEGTTAEAIRAKVANVSVLPHPFACIERDDPELDTLYTHQSAYLQTPTGRSHFPAHYFTAYRITFFSKLRQTDSYLKEWLFGQFGAPGCHPDEILLPVQHAPPYGVVEQSFKLQSLSRLDEVEGLALRRFRFEATFRLRTWIVRRAG